LLDYCRAMIAKILNSGEAYTMDGRSMNRSNLKDLWELENALTVRINAAVATGTGSKTNYASRQRAL